MSPAIFRAALRASAKVALTTTLASCGGRVAQQSTLVADAAARGAPPVEDPTADSSAPWSDEAMPASDGSASCDPPAASRLVSAASNAGALVDDAAFACCVSVLPLFLGEAGLTVASDAAVRQNPEAVDCCAAAVARIDGEYAMAFVPDASPGTLTADRRALAPVQWACCSLLDTAALEPLWAGVTCAPWGPPMPPSMPGEPPLLAGSEEVA